MDGRGRSKDENLQGKISESCKNCIVMEGVRFRIFTRPFFFITQLTNRQPITTIMLTRQAITDQFGV